MSSVLDEMRAVLEGDELFHYGTKYHSGRYPYGSGEDPFQHEGDFLTRIDRLKKIERMQEDGTFDVLPKKEVMELKKELAKLQKNLGGIKDMKRIPDAIFVVDPKKEHICVQEAQSLGITDTNCDPEELDFVIPGNDDAIRAVKLLTGAMADAVIEAKQGTENAAPAEEA